MAEYFPFRVGRQYQVEDFTYFGKNVSIHVQKHENDFKVVTRINEILYPTYTLINVDSDEDLTNQIVDNLNNYRREYDASHQPIGQ